MGGKVFFDPEVLFPDFGDFDPCTEQMDSQQVRLQLLASSPHPDKS